MSTPAADVLAERELELVSACVPPSTAYLQRLGFGWSTIELYRKRKLEAETTEFVELTDGRGKRHKVAPEKRWSNSPPPLQSD
jgi:hypothetical protein